MQPIVLNSYGKHQFRLNLMRLDGGEDFLSESRKVYLDNISDFIDDDPYRYEFVIYYFEIGIKNWFSKLKWKRIREHYPHDGVVMRHPFAYEMEFNSIDSAMRYWEEFVIKDKNYNFRYL